MDPARADILERWLAAVIETPGLTSLAGHEARRVLLDDAMRGVEVVSRFEGPIVDVGSGGGTPGIPLAAALPDREVTLLEAERRKTEFLQRWTAELPNLHVVWGRAEEHDVGGYGIAVAKALAEPVVSVEWCVPLVRGGGACVLWVGPTADPARVATAAERLGAELTEQQPGFFVLRRTGALPPGFPRRAGIAKKRPLA